jgi:hypothetical protein
MNYIIKVKTKNHESFYARQGNVAPGAKQLTSFVSKKEEAYKFSAKDEADYIKNYLKFSYSYDVEIIIYSKPDDENSVPKPGTVFILDNQPYMVCSHKPAPHVEGDMYVDHSKSIFCVNNLGKVIYWGRNDDYYGYIKSDKIKVLWEPA